MNEQQLASTAVGFAIAAVLFLIVIYFWRKRNMTAHLAPVKRELKKEKQWLRRGEYNAAMVKGRQNLELFLKLVAEFNGIELDNSAQAMANAKSGPDGRGQRETYRMNGRKRQRVMTFQQFGWWLDENGYLDRVGKWELNEIRVIGNKAVHENYVSKEDAYNQYNYMEDLLKIVSDRHANRHRQRGPEIKKSQAGRRGASVKKTSGTQAKGHGPQGQNRGQNQSQGRSQGRTGQSQSKNNSQGQAGRGQAKNRSQEMSQKREGGKQSGGKNGQNARPSGNARQDAKVSGKSGQQKSNGDQKTVQKAEIKKAAEQKGTANKQLPKKTQDGSKVKTAVNKAQQSKEAQNTVKAAAKTPAASLVEKNTESAQPEKLSSSAKRRQRRKRAKAAREAAEAAGMKQENTPQVKTVKQAENRPVRAEEKTAKQTETRPARRESRVERQPQTSMRIVTLSQSTGGRTAAGKDTAKQAARRRRPRRRPAAKNAERTVERTAAGGGDHEE